MVHHIWPFDNSSSLNIQGLHTRSYNPLCLFPCCSGYPLTLTDPARRTRACCLWGVVWCVRVVCVVCGVCGVVWCICGAWWVTWCMWYVWCVACVVLCFFLWDLRYEWLYFSLTTFCHMLHCENIVRESDSVRQIQISKGIHRYRLGNLPANWLPDSSRFSDGFFTLRVWRTLDQPSPMCAVAKPNTVSERLGLVNARGWRLEPKRLFVRPLRGNASWAHKMHKCGGGAWTKSTEPDTLKSANDIFQRTPCTLYTQRNLWVLTTNSLCKIFAANFIGISTNCINYQQKIVFTRLICWINWCVRLCNMRR